MPEPRTDAPLLLHVFASFAPGGPQVRTARLIRALGARYRHAILAMDGCTDARELLADDGVATVLEPLPRKGSAASAWRLRRLFASLRPDLLLTYNWGAIDAVLAARLAPRLPLLHHEDGFRPDELERFKRRRIWARRLLLARAARLIVPSRRLESIARELWRLSPERVRYIPNGIRVADFPPADGNPDLRQSLGIPADAVVLGSCGHLRTEKNPSRLIEALATMKTPAHALVLGDGPERAAVEALVRRHRLQSRVHLALHQEHPGPFYRAMDVFCLTSDTEQMPVALLEAMASALPVVSTDVGDVRAMLPADQGRFVLPLAGVATPVNLGAALDTLAGAATLRERLGHANRAQVQAQYSFEGMRDAHEAEWRLALGRASSAPAAPARP